MTVEALDGDIYLPSRPGEAEPVKGDDGGAAHPQGLLWIKKKMD